MGPSRRPREQLWAGMWLGVVVSVLCLISWCHELNSNNGTVHHGKYTQGLSQRRRLLAVQVLGGSATSLPPACDFRGNCGGQAHKLTVSCLTHYCLSTHCPRAVSTAAQPRSRLISCTILNGQKTTVLDVWSAN